MNIRQFIFNIFQENTIVAWDKSGRCVSIDPSFCDDAERKIFYDFLEKEGLVPEAILLTHCHFDHIYGVRELQDRYGIPVYMDPKEQVNLDYNDEFISKLGIPSPDSNFRYSAVGDGEIIEAAGMKFEVICTPGHAPGAVCYLEREQGVLFSGDTLFAGTIGRTDLKYSEYDDEIRSIMEKLMVLDAGIEIYPGHGPSSTIGRERQSNPFLEPFNEPEEEMDPDLPGIEIHPFN